MNQEDKTIDLADRIMKLWPVVALLVAGISGYLKLQWTVNDVASGQESWKRNSESRRERTHEEIDSVKNRLTQLETDMEWIKRRPKSYGE